MAGVIPFGQPILAGHYSEGRDRRYRGRIESKTRRALEDDRKAKEMRSKAANIAGAAVHAIYSDDPDAIEALEARLVELEAERARIKAYNASCRKGERNLELLTEVERAEVATVARVQPYSLGKGGGMPGYKLSNLSGNIKRNRDRLAALKAQA